MSFPVEFRIKDDSQIFVCFNVGDCIGCLCTILVHCSDNEGAGVCWGVWM